MVDLCLSNKVISFVFSSSEGPLCYYQVYYLIFKFYRLGQMHLHRFLEL